LNEENIPKWMTDISYDLRNLVGFYNQWEDIMSFCEDCNNYANIAIVEIRMMNS
jgi:hypothetical protein